MISWLAVLPLVGGAAVVRAVVDRELVGRPAVGLKIFVPNVVGLGVGLLVIEPAQWRQQAVLVLLAVVG